MMRRYCYRARISGCFVAMVLVLTTMNLGVAAAANPHSGSRIPGIMLYEGYLTDSVGKPLPDGQYDFTFALYASPTDDTPLWVESHKKVDVTNGLLRVYLGKGSPANSLDVPFDQQYFLGIRIGDDPEMAPRLELVTTAYSFRAKVADEVPDASITTEKLAPLSVTDDKIESISWEKIRHVPTAESGESISGKPPPVPANVWGIRGNLRTDAERHFLGTADSTDLILRTNNKPLLKLTADGKVIALGCLTSRVDSVTGCFYLADPEHGLKRCGNDDVHLYTTNGNILLEGGNVGIGTQNPEAALHIESAEAIPALMISSTLAGYDGSISSYPVRIYGQDQGIAIKLNTHEASSSNNYISFWDKDNLGRDQCVGRIEGQTRSEYYKDPYYIALAAHSAAIGVALGLAFAPQCVLSFVPDIEGIVANGATLAYNLAVLSFNSRNVGVSYSSGSADYAEYLPRLHQDERIEPGDIVGIFGGKVTKSTAGAQQILPVSLKPIVLGNTPREGQEHLFEKIAFMGQVEVKVIGPVRAGDFIIPSGLEDGTGIAIPPQMMTADEYAKVVGRAWSTSDVAFVKLVNVAVGLSPRDIAALVKRQQVEVGALRVELGEMRRQIEALAGLRQYATQLQATMARPEEIPVILAGDSQGRP